MTADDPSANLADLHSWLTRVPDARVELRPGRPAPGELGSGWDAVTAVCSSGAAIGVLRAVHVWIRSRQTRVRVSISDGDRKLEIEATHLDDPDAFAARAIDAFRAPA